MTDFEEKKLQNTIASNIESVKVDDILLLVKDDLRCFTISGDILIFFQLTCTWGNPMPRVYQMDIDLQIQQIKVLPLRDGPFLN